MVRIKTKYNEPFTDTWEEKLYNILSIRKKFQNKYGEHWELAFEQRFPLYHALLSCYEDTRAGGDRDVIEAMLLTSADYQTIDEEFKHPRFTALFLALYRTLLFDITPVLSDPVLRFQCFIQPMINMDSNKLAVGAIWKVLALTGGPSLLKRKGFGTEVIHGEDIEHILQLGCFRHCSTILQYASMGTEFFKDNPAAAVAVNMLTDFDSIRSSGRRPDYLAQISAVAKNNFNGLLTSEIKLLAIPEDRVLALTEFDGQFRPDIVDTIEYTSHNTFTTDTDNDE
jgi:hypothetical protein